jgi:hypothetical protein
MRHSVWYLVLLAVCTAASPDAAAATLKPETVTAWETYVRLTEKRIDSELVSPGGFLRADHVKPTDAQAIRTAIKNGQTYIQKLSTMNDNGSAVRVPDGLIHHWFGSIFVPKVGLESLLAWIQNYDQHHQYFKEVEQSKLLSKEGDTFKIFFRFVRKKVVTVHYNTNHTAIYRHHQRGQESSRSFTTRIAELENAGSASEKEKPVGDDSGFLWRLNSYWRFKEQDGGVVIECESISLSRSIPFGLGWLIKGFVESVPQESMESTLQSIRDGIAR